MRRVQSFRKAKHLKSWKTKDPSVVSASSSQVSMRSLARLNPSYYYSGFRRNAIACYRELVHATLVCMFPNITGNSIFHRWPFFMLGSNRRILTLCRGRREILNTFVHECQGRCCYCRQVRVERQADKRLFLERSCCLALQTCSLVQQCIPALLLPFLCDQVIQI